MPTKKVLMTKTAKGFLIACGGLLGGLILFVGVMAAIERWGGGWQEEQAREATRAHATAEAERRMAAAEAERKRLAAIEQQKAKQREAAEEAKWLQTKAGKIWQKHKDWDRDVCDRIAQSKISIGMTAEQCRLSWGRPTDINRTAFSFGVHEQWCYGEYCKPALYFENGLLVSWQD